MWNRIEKETTLHRSLSFPHGNPAAQNHPWETGRQNQAKLAGWAQVLKNEDTSNKSRNSQRLRISLDSVANNSGTIHRMWKKKCQTCIRKIRLLEIKTWCDIARRRTFLESCPDDSGLCTRARITVCQWVCFHWFQCSRGLIRGADIPWCPWPVREGVLISGTFSGFPRLNPSMG